MEILNHERFVAGNNELREILGRAERLENRTGGGSREELTIIQAHLLAGTPEIGDASRSETLDAPLLDEVAEYVRNLRALQHVIEKIRVAMADRRVASIAAKHHSHGLRGWIHGSRQTT
jgi:hypothetical protein